MANTEEDLIIETSNESDGISIPSASKKIEGKIDYAKALEMMKIEPRYDDNDESQTSNEALESGKKKNESFDLKQPDVNNDDYNGTATDNVAYTKSNVNLSKNEDIEDEYGEDFEENINDEALSSRKSDVRRSLNKTPEDKFASKGTSNVKTNNNENENRSRSQSKDTKLPQSSQPKTLNSNLNQKQINSGFDKDKKGNSDVFGSKTNSKNKSTEEKAKLPQPASKKESKPPLNKAVNKDKKLNQKPPSRVPAQNLDTEKKRESSVGKQAIKNDVIKKDDPKPEVNEEIEDIEDIVEDNVEEEIKSLNEELSVENKLKKNEESTEKLNFRIRPASAVVQKKPEENFSKTQKDFTNDTGKSTSNFHRIVQDKKSSTLQGFKIKPPKPQKHTDILREIFEEYKQKEKKMQEKDENIYALEVTEKRIKSDQNQVSNSEHEDNWVGNGLGMKPKVTEKPPIVKKSNITRDLAANFLANMQKKIGSAPGADKKKPDQEKTKKETAKLEEKKEDHDLFEVEQEEAGDQALPEMENKIDNIPSRDVSKEERPKSSLSKENTLKKEKKNDGKSKDDSKWSYQVGNGIATDYEKTQKERQKANQQRFTELFKNEKKRKQEVLKQNLQKQKEVLTKERENRKNQKVEMAKPIKVDEKKIEKDSGVLQVHAIYEEETRRDKELRDKKEIADLKEKLKILKEANLEIKKNLNEMEEKDKEATKLLEELTSRKAVISLGKNTFTTFGLVPASNSEDLAAESTEDTSTSIISHDLKNFQEDNFSPIELVVNKIADQGYDLDSLYQTLDSNGDGVLTLKEIREGFEKLNLELSRKDVEEIIRVLDKNTDGLISLYEFKQNLTESLELRKEYKAIMGNLDKIANPLVLEERILDIEIRKKVIHEELKKVMDDIVYDEKEYHDKLNQLKKYDNIAGPKEESKKSGLDQYKDTILKAKVELQDLNEIQNRTLLLQDDRINDIKTTILNIESEITKTIQEIYKEKRKLRDKIDEEQKDQIRKLFMEKLYSDLDKELESNEQGINKNVMRIIEERQKYTNQVQEKEIAEKFENYAREGAARKIQNAYRCKKMRAEFKNEMAKLAKAKRLIIHAYRRFKIKNKQFVALAKLKSVFFKRIVAALVMIKEKTAVFINDSQEKNLVSFDNDFAPSEALPMQKKRDVLSYYEKYLIYNLSERFKGFKKFLGEKLNLEIPELKGKCKICEKNKIQRICGKCELSLFCENCFNLSHGRARNHIFIDIDLNSKPKNTFLDEFLIRSKIEVWNKSRVIGMVPEQIKKIKETWKADLRDILKHFKVWDHKLTGYFEKKDLTLVLSRKIKNSPIDINEIVEFATKNCVLCTSTQSDKVKIDYVSLAKILS